MSRFHDLTVTHIHRTIKDAVVLTLAPQSGDFSFVQGQYLTFKQEFEGVELRRSYSICAGRDEGVLKVGIKRVDGGAFSTWANQDLQVGMNLSAMEPMGQFHTECDPETAHHHLGFAGGSGITPVLSILKTTLASEPKSRFTLVYANRGVHSIMFREDLDDLKNLYMERLTILHVLESDAQDIELLQGRVDGEKCAGLFAHWIDVSSVDTAFICGPEPMMLSIAEALRAHGMNDSQIKYELFASGQPGRLSQKPASDRAQVQAKTKASITLDGATRVIDVNADQSILDAALDNSIDVPFACKAGVCSTCKCKLLKGEVDMAANHALEDYEVRAGYILSCQSYPTTDDIVVDYDVGH